MASSVVVFAQSEDEQQQLQRLTEAIQKSYSPGIISVCPTQNFDECGQIVQKYISSGDDKVMAEIKNFIAKVAKEINISPSVVERLFNELKQQTNRPSEVVSAPKAMPAQQAITHTVNQRPQGIYGLMDDLRKQMYQPPPPPPEPGEEWEEGNYGPDEDEMRERLTAIKNVVLPVLQAVIKDGVVPSYFAKYKKTLSKQIAKKKGNIYNELKRMWRDANREINNLTKELARLSEQGIEERIRESLDDIRDEMQKIDFWAYAYDDTVATLTERKNKVQTFLVRLRELWEEVKRNASKSWLNNDLKNEIENIEKHLIPNLDQRIADINRMNQPQMEQAPAIQGSLIQTLRDFFATISRF
jgi:hypothetical protein